MVRSHATTRFAFEPLLASLQTKGKGFYITYWGLVCLGS